MALNLDSDSDSEDFLEQIPDPANPLLKELFDSFMDMIPPKVAPSNLKSLDLKSFGEDLLRTLNSPNLNAEDLKKHFQRLDLGVKIEDDELSKMCDLMISARQSTRHNRSLNDTFNKVFGDSSPAQGGEAPDLKREAVKLFESMMKSPLPSGKKVPPEQIQEMGEFMKTIINPELRDPALKEGVIGQIFNIVDQIFTIPTEKPIGSDALKKIQDSAVDCLTSMGQERQYEPAKDVFGKLADLIRHTHIREDPPSDSPSEPCLDLDSDSEDFLDQLPDPSPKSVPEEGSDSDSEDFLDQIPDPTSDGVDLQHALRTNTMMTKFWNEFDRQFPHNKEDSENSYAHLTTRDMIKSVIEKIDYSEEDSSITGDSEFIKIMNMIATPELRDSVRKEGLYGKMFDLIDYGIDHPHEGPSMPDLLAKIKESTNDMTAFMIQSSRSEYQRNVYNTLGTIMQSFLDKRIAQMDESGSEPCPKIDSDSEDFLDQLPDPSPRPDLSKELAQIMENGQPPSVETLNNLFQVFERKSQGDPEAETAVEIFGAVKNAIESGSNKEPKDLLGALTEKLSKLNHADDGTEPLREMVNDGMEQVRTTLDQLKGLQGENDLPPEIKLALVKKFTKVMSVTPEDSDWYESLCYHLSSKDNLPEQAPEDVSRWIQILQTRWMCEALEIPDYQLENSSEARVQEVFQGLFPLAKKTFHATELVTDMSKGCSIM